MTEHVSFPEPWRSGQSLIRITNRKHGSVYYIRGVKLLQDEGLVYRLANGTKPYLLFLDSYIEVERVTEDAWLIEEVWSE
jgi:hypothetical protein